MKEIKDHLNKDTVCSWNGRSNQDPSNTVKMAFLSKQIDRCNAIPVKPKFQKFKLGEMSPSRNILKFSKKSRR